MVHNAIIDDISYMIETLTYCFSPLGLLQEIYHKWIAYEQQKFISHNLDCSGMEKPDNTTSPR